MATSIVAEENQQTKTLTTRSVRAVQPVSLALVEYVDESNQVVRQLAIIGEKNVHLLESRTLGISKNTTPNGRASSWLAEGIRALFNKKGSNS